MKRLMASTGAALALLLYAVTPAHALLLNKSFSGEPFLDTTLTGTTNAARPELSGIVLADIVQPFSVPALNISGNVQSRVAKEDGTGTLDFYWHVTVDRASTGGAVSAFRLIDFGYDDIVDGDYRVDSVGTATTPTARVFNPASAPNGAINFLFSNPGVLPGDPNSDANGSHFFFLHTDATTYAQTASYDLLVGANQTLTDIFSTFAPTPEPSCLTLAAVGAAALLRRRR